MFFFFDLLPVFFWADEKRIDELILLRVIELGFRGVVFIIWCCCIDLVVVGARNPSLSCKAGRKDIQHIVTKLHEISFER